MNEYMKEFLGRINFRNNNGELLLLDSPVIGDYLSPYIGERTLRFHYEKHLKGYIDKVNGFMKTAGSYPTIEEIISTHSDKSVVFRNASQVFNHYFYFEQLNLKGRKNYGEKTRRLIEKSFISAEAFEKLFMTAGEKIFGSGWVWLVQTPKGAEIVSYEGTGTPLSKDKNPLIAMDVWEHAYYLDYQNDRFSYIRSFMSCIDWGVIENRILD